MAITQTVVLPAQPAAGDVVYVPLGGDGLTSPQSMYEFSIDQTGDASGGNATIEIDRDPRFEQLIDFLNVQAVVTTAVLWQINIRRDRLRAVVGGSTIPGVLTSHAMYSPPAIIDPFQWSMTIPNVDLQVSRLKGVVYNFNIQASEKVPLSILLASVRRSSNIA